MALIRFADSQPTPYFCNMEGTGESYGSFNVKLDGGFLNIHPEMAPEDNGFNPTGRYFVYALLPGNGSCHFIVEQDEHCNWVAEYKPVFVSQDVIERVGGYIENRQH